MTQQWGNQGGQRPNGAGQWPAEQSWNRPAQAWGPQPYGQGSPTYGPSAPWPYQPPPPQARFGQPGYGQPGSFPQPRPNPGGPRKSRLRSFVLGVVLVVGTAFFAVSLLHYLNGGTDQAGPASTQTSRTQPTVTVPRPDSNPAELPQPRTYEEAAAWVEQNPVYQQSAPVPTDCQVPGLDMTTASVGELNTHLNGLTACLWQVWSGPLEEAGYELPRPPVTVHTGPITTGCGTQEDVNAVYCAADQRIYYAKDLWKVFPPDQRRQPFVVDAVLAHEFGHTIQARTGILISSIGLEQNASTTAEGRSFSRRLEVQADCLSGMFASAVAPSSGLSRADLANLREVFYNLGDDVLSGEANIQGDHGLGRSRRTWFATGTDNTLIGTCNTFTAPEASVR